MVLQKTQVITTRKTGFKNLTPNTPVIIKDYRGKLFYSNEHLLNKPKCFNLPEGNFFIVSGSIEPLKFPVPVKLSKLPSPERNYPNPLDFQISFGNNPNKCSIIWKKKLIFFDNSLKNSTLPEVFFILYHEYGHQLYKTEKYADLFSANLMKKKGYNDSQIGAAPITSLSPRQIARKTHIVDKVLKRQRKPSLRLRHTK